MNPKLCISTPTGTKAPPRSWEIWNFEALEPFDLRKDERIQEAAAKGDNKHIIYLKICCFGQSICL